MQTSTNTAPPVKSDRPISFSITSCSTCPFYAHKYCGLSQQLNAQYDTDYSTFVVNEWKQGIVPERCPLKNADWLFSLNELPGYVEADHRTRTRQ